MVKNQPANAGDMGSIPGSGRSPGKGNGNPLQYSCLENPMDGGACQDYSPWGHKESDTTERLSVYLEQYSFELHGSSYIPILKNKYIIGPTYW